MTKRQYIAIGVDKERKIWQGHFGMSPVYFIYDENGEIVDQRVNPYGAGNGKKKHHDNPQLIADLLPDCKVFLARRMGGGSKQQLALNLGVTPVLTTERYPDGAVRAYLSSPDTDAPSKPDWVTNTTFETADARLLSGFFLPEILSQAGKTPQGMGFEVIQSFEPVPLYQTMANLGWDEHFTEQTANDEYHIYFIRSGKQTAVNPLSIDLQPTAAARVPIALQSATPAPAPIISDAGIGKAASADGGDGVDKVAAMRLILIVDDDPLLREALCDLLTHTWPRLRVLEAQNGREGVMMAIAEHPDLIFLDGLMPFMNGYETAQQLRQNPETKNVPLIGITSETGEAPIAAGLKALCDGWLPKPFSITELQHVLSQVGVQRDKND